MHIWTTGVPQSFSSCHGSRDLGEAGHIFLIKARGSRGRRSDPMKMSMAMVMVCTVPARTSAFSTLFAARKVSHTHPHTPLRRSSARRRVPSVTLNYNPPLELGSSPGAAARAAYRPGRRPCASARRRSQVAPVPKAGAAMAAAAVSLGGAPHQSAAPRPTLHRTNEPPTDAPTERQNDRADPRHLG